MAEATELECPVCYETIGQLAKYLKCFKCGAICCQKCQISSEKPNCTSCGTEFTRHQLIDVMSKKELDTSSLASYWSEIYFQREQSLLNIAQSFIQEQRKVEKEKSQRRFGKRGRANLTIDAFFNEETQAGDTEGDYLPKNKKEYSLNFSNFNCSDATCRGIVTNDTRRCGLCKKVYCFNCHELEDKSDPTLSQIADPIPKNLTEKIPGSTHMCDPANIATIAQLHKDSKKCPACGTLINKSAGCNHMRCTYCGCYFNWSTGKITSRNSNPITNTEIFGKHTANMCIAEMSIWKSREYESDSANINRDAGSLLYYYQKNYTEEVITRSYRDRLLVSRVKYLDNKFTMAEWKRDIYKIELDVQRRRAIGEIIVLALEAYVDMINQNAIWKAMEVYNQSTKKIQQEYGGKWIVFKTGSSDPPYLEK